MNLLELATGDKSSEYRITLLIVCILGCQALGIDILVLLQIVLPYVLSGSDLIKYEEVIRLLGTAKTQQNTAATWALAIIGVGYPAARVYVKSLKAKLTKVTQ